MQEKILQTENQEEREGVKNMVHETDIWEKNIQAILDAKKDLTASIVEKFKSPKTRSSIKDSMRSMAELMGYSTYQYFLQDDDEYIQLHKKIYDLEDICLNLEIDTEKQEKVTNLIQDWNSMEYHFVANAYLAGLLDGYGILKEFEIVD